MRTFPATHLYYAKDNATSNILWNCIDRHYRFGMHAGEDKWGDFVPKTPGFAVDLELNGEVKYDPIRFRYHPKELAKVEARMIRGVVTSVNALGNNRYSLLAPELIKQLGKPLHFPELPANLTHTCVRNLSFHPDGNEPLWVDRRGALSCIGSNYRTLLKKLGTRTAISCAGYARNRHREHAPEYFIKRVSGATAAKAGNWFLYSQNLNIFDPYTKTARTILWIGLASCMSIEYLYRYPGASAVVRAALRPAKPGYLKHPLCTWTNNFLDLKWDKEHWERFSNQSLEKYAKPKNASILETLAKLEFLTTSPKGMKVQRLNALAKSKKAELAITTRIVHHHKDEVLELQRRTDSFKRELERIKANLEQEQARLDQRTQEMELHSRKQELQHAILKKMNAGIDKMNAEHTAELKEELSLTSSSGSYADGLAKSGIVIDDIYYKHIKSDETESAIYKPEIIGDVSWKLQQVKMHTTRPIKIHFGIEKEKPRASGPHRLDLYRTPIGEIRMLIKPLVPWAAGSWQNGRYKVYPHSPGWCFGIDSKVEDFVSYNEKEAQGICMGELSAAADQAFRTNNPKNAALAVLAFLQSVNPTDVWGKSYKYFPLWEDVIKAPKKIGPFVESAPQTAYYVNADRTKFLEYLAETRTLRYGDLATRRGVPVETSSALRTDLHERFNCTRSRISTINYGPWVASPLLTLRKAHEGSPSWTPRSIYLINS